MAVAILCATVAVYASTVKYQDIAKCRAANGAIYGVRSMADGEHFTIIKGKQIVRCSYADRKDSEFIGTYQGKVSEQYFSYIRPQESGNHTDIRWFSVYSQQTGKGLKFCSVAPMECSALNYLVEDLDDGWSKDKSWGRHSGDLIERPLTQVHIQQHQQGLACVNSWGAWPLPQYRIKYKDREFVFVITPFDVNK